MNVLRKLVGVAAVGAPGRMMDRARAAKPRRFRPLAEPMEARALLSHVALAPAMADPVPTGPGAGAMVVVNGQVEMQPGQIVVNGQVEMQPGQIAAK